ncbi:hypothetical protein FHT44_005010 [Mycolicibacterium sp. BK634]|uniref:DUF4406 domain-containing protein n=1 Tax=Mycolicibacterium sp. BK634 TaxID=2587099 RepID=UPI00160877BF|nr:DUF4406 domain-containing protein [Mycolicibacterium sp. BK634]MBB3752498.1 hypothetical protein [Mycolicibacterium sp. BK634]
MTDHPNARGLIYIAGPMTLYGPPNWGYEHFADMAKRLRAAGFDVISPHELHGPEDAPQYGDDDPDSAWGWFLRRDIRELAKCGRIVMLPDWEKSRGAQLEFTVAKALEMEIIYAHEVDDLLKAAA